MWSSLRLRSFQWNAATLTRRFRRLAIAFVFLHVLLGEFAGVAFVSKFDAVSEKDRRRQRSGARLRLEVVLRSHPAIETTDAVASPAMRAASRLVVDLANRSRGRPLNRFMFVDVFDF